MQWLHPIDEQLADLRGGNELLTDPRTIDIHQENLMGNVLLHRHLEALRRLSRGETE
jgi:hypothetical protein